MSKNKKTTRKVSDNLKHRSFSRDDVPKFPLNEAMAVLCVFYAILENLEAIRPWGNSNFIYVRAMEEIIIHDLDKHWEIDTFQFMSKLHDLTAEEGGAIIDALIRAQFLDMEVVDALIHVGLVEED